MSSISYDHGLFNLLYLLQLQKFISVDYYDENLDILKCRILKLNNLL